MTSTLDKQPKEHDGDVIEGSRYISIVQEIKILHR